MAIFEVDTKGRPMRVADRNFDDSRDRSRSFQAMAKSPGDAAPGRGGAGRLLHPGAARHDVDPMVALRYE